MYRYNKYPPKPKDDINLFLIKKNCIENLLKNLHNEKKIMFDLRSS